MVFEHGGCLLPECYMTVHQSPKFTITQMFYPGSEEESFHDTSLKQMLHVLAKIENGITGFLSKTGLIFAQ